MDSKNTRLNRTSKPSASVYFVNPDTGDVITLDLNTFTGTDPRTFQP
jgi:hypothetical protein